jgi:hypothetical protein
MDLNTLVRSRNFQVLLVAVLVVAIIILIGSSANIGDSDGDGDGPGGEPPLEPPFVLSEQGFNHPVQDAFQGSNEPHIASNPLNPMNMVAGSNDYSSPKSDAWVGYYWTFDGGKRWERNLVPGYPSGPVSALTGFEAAGDAVVAAGPDGEFYMAGIAFKRSIPAAGRASSIFVAKSTDGGRTFGQVTMVAQSLTVGTFHDKEWIAVDQSDGPGRGNIYVAWAMFQPYGSQMVFSRSTDGGNTWSRPPRILSDLPGLEFQLQGSQVVVDNQGTIHITWIDFQGGQHRYVRSTDQGQSFSDPVDIGEVTPIDYELPNGGYRTPTLPALAVDNTGGPFDGSLYLTWNDQRSGDADVLMIYSSDGGNQWSSSIRVNDDANDTGADQFFPSIIVAGNGTVCVSFYDRRDDENNTLLMIYHAQSIDGGETFLPNIPITDVQFDGNAAGGRRKGGVFSGTPFMGDYTGSAAGDGFVVPIWCDTRNGTPDAPNSDLYVARVAIAEVEVDTVPA